MKPAQRRRLQRTHRRRLIRSRDVPDARSRDPKEVALEGLAERRRVNEKRKRRDNSSLPAGSPMYFDCTECQGEIAVPENYDPRTRQMVCNDCQPLKDNGWL